MKPPVDPSVWTILRTLLAFEMILFGATSVAFLEHDSPDHAQVSMAVMLAMGIAAFGAVSACRLRNAQPWFLPSLLIWMAIIPTTGQALAVHYSPAAWFKLALEVSLLSIVPIIVIAWQLTFSKALWVICTIAVVDGGIALAASTRHGALELQLHVVVARTVGLIFAAFVVARLAAAQRQQHQTLELAHAALAQHASNLERLTISRERNRIARELHDTLAHSLSSLAVQLEATRWLDAADSRGIQGALDACLKTARSGLTEVRRALTELRATPLESLGLALAIRGLAEGLAERMGAALECQVDVDEESLPEPIVQGAFRIAQEALGNIERHSGAKRVQLSLLRLGASLRLVVEDDGRGFDVRNIPSERYGVRGMRERAELVSGSLELTSTPGKGTRVSFEVTPATGLTPAAERNAR